LNNREIVQSKKYYMCIALKMIYMELVNFFLNSKSKKSKTGLKVPFEGAINNNS